MRDFLIVWSASFVVATVAHLGWVFLVVQEPQSFEYWSGAIWSSAVMTGLFSWWVMRS